MSEEDISDGLFECCRLLCLCCIDCCLRCECEISNKSNNNPNDNFANANYTTCIYSCQPSPISTPSPPYVSPSGAPQPNAPPPEIVRSGDPSAPPPSYNEAMGFEN